MSGDNKAATKAGTDEMVSIPKDVLICLARNFTAFYESACNHIPADFLFTCSTCELGNDCKCDTNVVWEKAAETIEKSVGIYPKVGSGIGNESMEEIHIKMLDAVKKLFAEERKKAASSN